MLTVIPDTTHPYYSQGPVTRITGTTADVLESLAQFRAAPKDSHPTMRRWWHPGDDHWDLGLGIDDSIDMARSGWAAGIRGLDALVSKVAHLATEIPDIAMLPAVYGPIWDMPAVIDGRPYCAYQFGEVPERRLLKLVVNGYYSCGVDASDLERRARAVSALVQVLHTAGFELECSIVYGASERHHGAGTVDCVQEITVHKAGEVFDLERVAFWLGHPGAVRNLIYGSQAAITQHTTGGSLRGFDARLAKETKAAGGIYVGGMHLDNDSDSIRACRTEAGAVRWIKEQIERVVAL
jgi:hypothetical protein